MRYRANVVKWITTIYSNITLCVKRYVLKIDLFLSPLIYYFQMNAFVLTYWAS